MAEFQVADVKKSDEIESFVVIFDALKTVCKNNADFFSTDDSDYGKRLNLAFVNIIEHVSDMEPKVAEISQVVKHYDYNEKTPGNGFRSFLSVTKASITFCIQMGRKVCVKRSNILFRKSNILREVESCNELLASISTCLQHVITLTKWCPPGNLFVNMEHSPEELLSQAENINQYCFYGRCLGFQYCESLRNVLKFISLSMAIFSEAYYNHGSFLSKATNSIWSSGKYVLDPDTRARRIVNISQNAEVDFCKAFWYLSESEVMMRLPSIVSSSVAVSHVIAIPPEPLQYENEDGSIVHVPIPLSHVGLKSINVRLISHVAREGMVGVTGSRQNLAPLNPAIIIHCHGGGFVAQSSRSHEIYLRDWAQHLGVSILSVDYSLAPDAPFPRAIEEVFYAYCWALKNCRLLGTTAKTVILAGDSAGGNLCTGVAMKCIESEMRPPDGLFLAYVPVLVEFNPSPSRMLCIMDPLLPFGFMMRCLRAYACTDPKQLSKNGTNNHNGATSSDTESFEEVSESDLLELQAHKSPISETSDTLTNVSLSSQPMSNSSKPSENTVMTEVKMEKGESQKYVSEILEKYVLDSDTDSDGARVRVLHTTTSKQTVGSVDSTPIVDQTLQQKLTGFVGALTSRLSRWRNKKRVSPAQMFLDVDRQKSLVEEFKFTVPRDPYLSPYWAKNEVLKRLPPIRILTVELDPCLDDCVMFAKKLNSLKVDVDLDILEGLPHGFLNFSAISKEAHQGSKRCLERIKELLEMKSQPPNEDEID